MANKSDGHFEFVDFFEKNWYNKDDIIFIILRRHHDGI